MPTTSINWDQVSTHVGDKMVPRVRNNVMNANPMWYRLKDRQESFTGGRKIVYPLAFEVEGGGGQFWSGNDRIDIRHRNPITAAEYYAINYALAITVLQEEEDTVQGAEQVMPLVATKMKLANRTAVSALGGSDGIFSAGTNPKAISGLEVALPDNPDTLHTYGGIQCSSTVNPWWRPQVDRKAYVTGTGGGANFIQAANWGPFDNAWAQIAFNSDGLAPTLGLVNWGVFNDISQACTKMDSSYRPQQDTNMRKAGFINITYKNCTIIVDVNVPRNSTTKKEKAYLLNETSYNLVVHEARNFSFMGWRQALDQFLRVAYILWRGQLCFSERRCNLKFTDIDTTATSPA